MGAVKRSASEIRTSFPGCSDDKIIETLYGRLADRNFTLTSIIQAVYPDGDRPVESGLAQEIHGILERDRRV